ncbi:MAG: hypothetical protein MI725_15910 [Pirellulales bacterium]|nr:hypothetical protein [Pirellulales bacterium]
MRWKRKKPLWPLLIAISFLFVLAIEAPRSWQGDCRRDLPPILRKSPQSPSAIVVLKPQQQSSESLSSETPPALPPLEHSPPDAEESVLAVPPPISEPLPDPREYDFGTLMQIRDVLLSAIDRVQEELPEADAATSYDPTRVRVSSPSDRLAMVDNRTGLRRQPHQAAPSTSGPSIDDFAKELLPATEQPPTRVVDVPRLAQRKSVSAQGPVLAPQQSMVPAALRTRPKQLIQQLQSLADKSSSKNAWAAQALPLIEQLADTQSTTPIDTQSILDALARLAEAGINESSPISQPSELETALALERRLCIWRVLLESAPISTTVADPTPSAYTETMMPLLGEIASLLEGEVHGADWRDYLLLDSLASAASESLADDQQSKRTELAQKALARMEDARLTDAQRAFLATEPLAKLQRQLQPWATGPVNLELLDALVEHYESGHEVRYAAAIAQLQQRMRWSTDVRLQSLAQQLDQHYRGANMRIAITDDLMNRMIPKQKVIVRPVRERVAGSKVRGKSRTTSQARVRLLPDAESWRFALEAFGKVYSETRSETWPARVQNAAKMQFQARKLIVVSQEGLKVAPATAQAQGRNELKGVESQFDLVPIAGYVLRDLARQKHHKSRPLALKQVKSKVATQARRRMDHQTDAKLAGLEQKFRDQVLTPLSRLALLAEPVDMHTTAQRAVINVRLANRRQLAAHTQRPFAPADSLASFQLHETALNNALAGLGLNGRRMKAAELFEFVTKKLGRTEVAMPEDLPQRAVIEFAAHDAVRIRCDGDRLELILGIKQLSKGRDKIKNFEVHAFFRPVTSGLDVQLVRDGTLQFAGRRLKTGARVVLHSVMGKLLRKDQELNLLRSPLGSDPRFAGLMVTQLEFSDGWIALALGPAHAARSAWLTREQRLHDASLLR